MTKGMGTALWREWESGNSTAVRVLRVAVLFFGLLFLCFTASIGLPGPEQAALALLTVGVTVWLDRASSSYLVTLTLMLASVYSTFRYGLWRVVTTSNYLRDASTPHRWAELLIMLVLLLSECYAFMALLLGYVQMLWPLRRTPVPLPEDTSQWPAVDILIPTLNEPLDVVRFTALAAANIDWPADRLNVYILDDGRRDEFRRFAEEAGLGYMTRYDTTDAKAGNLNAALERLDSPFVAIFDADHVPTRSFLQVAMGWFLRDARLGILQTPHHFYSPDPFERNLRQFRTIPNEDELFYGLVQDGNDFWNATYFCGSCAVLRRRALDEAGGLAVETVTEDAHTSMRMQCLGWNSAYINIPQAAGLATERLSEHVRQRKRWARGMVQILRIENPLFARGLTFAQRLCYFNSMSHFLYALPRLVFLTAPMMYLLFGYSTIAGGWAAILAYAAPHLLLGSITRSRIQGAHRHSFWTEIYETVLAPHLLLPTLSALLRPRAGRFNVTAKGTVVDKEFFDGRVALPTLFLLSLNWFGFCCTVPRLVQFPVWQVPAWARCVNWFATLYDPAHAGTALINAGWTAFNLILLGVAAAVAWESRQRRRTVRMQTQLPSEVILADGSVVHGITCDLSSGGLRTVLEYDLPARVGEAVRVVLPVLDGTAALPAIVVAADGRVLRARFDKLSLEEVESLTLLLYSRADRWLGWDEEREPDQPVRSLVHVLRVAMRGLLHTVIGPMDSDPRPQRGGFLSIVPLITLFLLAGLGERTAGGQTNTPAPGSFHQVIRLEESGLAGPLNVGTSATPGTVQFVLPQNELVKSATLHLHYSVRPGEHLDVALNGTPLATLPVVTLASSAPRAGNESASAPRSADIPVPAEVLLRTNLLSFAVADASCTGDHATGTETTEVDPASSLELAGTLVPLQDELGLLPVPFYQPGLTSSPVVTMAFQRSPDVNAARAAGIVASWFGTIADRVPLHFAVAYGTIPRGDVILIAENPAALPSSLNIAGVSGPMLAMRTNPEDPYGKLLILTGARPEDLVKAARTLVLQRSSLQGPELAITGSVRAAARAPDDAPRWLGSTDLRFSSNGTADVIPANAQDGLATVPLRLPPSLFFGAEADGQTRRSLPLHISYQYEGTSVGQGSELVVEANGRRIASLPLQTSANKTIERDVVVAVPVGALQPFDNVFSFRFVHPPGATAAPCIATASSPGAILGSSWLDIGGVPHWAALPDLALFRAGYPFTRRADLSSTAVVLPDAPTPSDLTLFLSVMSRFGAATGYPAAGVTVVASSRIAPGSGLDYLVLGTFKDGGLLRRFAPNLPVTVSGGELEPEQPRGVARLMLRWKGAGADQLSTALRPSSGAQNGLIEQIEWPRRSRHTVTVVLASSEKAIPVLLDSLWGPEPLAGSVAIVRNGTIASYQVARESYMVGRTTLLMAVVNLLSRMPWVIAAVSLLFCFLIASMLRSTLRRGARTRLQGTY